MHEFLDLVTPLSAASSALFGAMIGGLYGYPLAPTRRTIYPVLLWVVGLGFVALTATFAQASDGLNRGPGYSIGRAALWTIVCASIPLGRMVAWRVVNLYLGWRARR